ncbi:MAG: hypothetical protein AAFY20_25625 [Cyanobacteria bacterium J06639_14]
MANVAPAIAFWWIALRLNTMLQVVNGADCIYSNRLRTESSWSSLATTAVM